MNNVFTQIILIYSIDFLEKKASDFWIMYFNCLILTAQCKYSVKIKFSIHEYNISLMYWPNLLNIFPRIKFEFLNIFNPQLFNISRQSEIGFSSWLFIRIKTSVIRLFTFGGFFRISYSLWLPMRLCFPKPFDI